MKTKVQTPQQCWKKVKHFKLLSWRGERANVKRALISPAREAFHHSGLTCLEMWACNKIWQGFPSRELSKLRDWCVKSEPLLHSWIKTDHLSHCLVPQIPVPLLLVKRPHTNPRSPPKRFLPPSDFFPKRTNRCCFLQQAEQWSEQIADIDRMCADEGETDTTARERYQEFQWKALESSYPTNREKAYSRENIRQNSSARPGAHIAQRSVLYTWQNNTEEIPGRKNRLSDKSVERPCFVSSKVEILYY